MRGDESDSRRVFTINDQEVHLFNQFVCSNSKLSGNEVYYTIFKTFLVKIMLSSKLHCHKVLN